MLGERKIKEKPLNFVSNKLLEEIELFYIKILLRELLLFS
jgi:hypothetical protein